MNITIRALVLGGALLCASLSHAIGRSGNGKIVGWEDGFEADSPSAYLLPKKMQEGGLRLARPFAMPGSSSQDDHVDLRRLVVEYPTKANATRVEFVEAMLASGWRQVLSNDACKESFGFESANIRASLVAWGADRGVVILGVDAPSVAFAIDEIVRTLVIDPGACSWK